MYDFKQVEKKWQDVWESGKFFEAKDFDERPKFYGLIEFPYPSGSGLHVGHLRAFTSLEIISRKRRLEGYNVLFPMGFDAFGLPTENFAMQTGQHPRVVTDKNCAEFLKQLKLLGYSFDYSRVIDTTDPVFYKWTQWIFIQLFKHGLAYKSKAYVNYCEKCQVVLANEESQGGVCDRCNDVVIQKQKDVWFLKIREYADKLLAGLDEVDYLPRIKTEQINWIGRSEGAEIDFDSIKVFTTRADTIFGATFMVIAPEHPFIEQNAKNITNMDEVEAYKNATRKKNAFERVHVNKDKTGVELKGVFVVNPATGAKMPVFIADYVTMDYGTGAIMAVPAHDARDFEFAKKYGLPIVEVVAGGDIKNAAYTDISKGKLINSDFLNGLTVADAIQKMFEWLEQCGVGKKQVNYNMKDWAFNRQRYWGEPIPIIYCPKCGAVPVPDEELPLLLPELESYRQTADGESPLANIESFVNCKCPLCGLPSKRETDTMPQWAGSSWYFLRYIDPNNQNALADMDKLKYFGPVDWYNGGMEHVTRHLIYSRFWNHFLYDIGAIPFREPYKKRTAQGLILGEDGQKMSKSIGNVVNPDDVTRVFGADVLRLFILFIGDYECSVPWSSSSISGCKRFLDRVYGLLDKVKPNSYSEKHVPSLNRLIKKVSSDCETLKFNTAIAAMMSFVNDMYADDFVTKNELKTLLLLLYPFAPHLAEEVNQKLGHKTLLADSEYPKHDPTKLEDDEIEIPVQVNGKLKGTIKIPKDADFEAVKKVVLADPALAPLVVNPKKEIYVPKKIVNFIV